MSQPDLQKIASLHPERVNSLGALKSSSSDPVARLESLEILKARVEEDIKVAEKEIKALPKVEEEAQAPSEGTDDTGTDEAHFADLTVAQLKEMAKADGVDITGLSKKAEIIEAFSK